VAPHAFETLPSHYAAPRRVSLFIIVASGPIRKRRQNVVYRRQAAADTESPGTLHDKALRTVGGAAGARSLGCESRSIL
jgi:hypothetical protein